MALEVELDKKKLEYTNEDGQKVRTIYTGHRGLMLKMTLTTLHGSSTTISTGLESSANSTQRMTSHHRASGRPTQTGVG